MGDIIPHILSISWFIILSVLYAELHTIKRAMKCKHICTTCKHKKQCFEDMTGENNAKAD